MGETAPSTAITPDKTEPGHGTTPDPEGPAPLGPRRLRLVGLVALSVVVLDQLSKHWALNALSDGHVVDVVGSLRFNLFFNRGVAFSLGSHSGVGPWVSVLAVVVVVGVSFGATSRIPLGAVASGLISGGAAGNLIDRALRGDDGFLHGAVVDFIDLQWWPVFNLADAAIVVGGAALVLVGNRLGARAHDTPAHDVPALDE